MRKMGLLDLGIVLVLVVLAGAMLTGYQRVDEIPAAQVQMTAAPMPTAAPTEAAPNSETVYASYVFVVCLGSEPAALEDRSTPEAAYVRAAAVGTTGNGPYIIREWTAGDRIVMEKNPGYYRANEGLPIFGYLIFRFVGENANANIAAVLSGECDIVVDGSGALAEQERLIRELEHAGQIAIIGSIEGRDFVIARADICGVESDWGQSTLIRHLDEWGYGRICIH